MLTMEDVRRQAPAAFTETNPMSDRYVQVPTYKVVEQLSEAGYVPVQASQDKPTRRDPRFVNHKIVLRHENYLKPKVGLDQVPQIFLLNSHNGRTKMKLFAGFYRFICSNGLVVGRDLYQYDVRHVGDAYAETMGFADTMTTELDKLHNVIDDWSEKKLKLADQQSFAQRAAVLRFGEEKAPSYPVESILEARRDEDKGDSVWRVFNRVQENTTQGGIRGMTANRRRISSRPLNTIWGNTLYNMRLWNLAEEYAEAA